MLNMLHATALALLLTMPGWSAQAPPAAPKPVTATPQNAAAFLGDWDLSGEGSNGPASFTLSLKPQGETVTAVLTNRDNAPQTVNEISVVGSALALDVTFENAGTGYPAVVSLTPSGDTVALHIEVANGLAQLDGTAKKKAQK